MRQIGEKRFIMAKNQINFTKMTEEASAQLKSFKNSAFTLANEDLRYKAELKPLKEQLEIILANRQNDINAGLSAEEVAQKFPRTDVDNAIRKAQTKHDSIIEPLNKEMKDTYKFIPETMFPAYIKKIDEHKRGDFLTAIKDFLSNLGIEGCTQGQISKLAENMSDMFGAKYATSKKIVKDGNMVTTLKKQQFDKLFMAVFCDMYVK